MAGPWEKYATAETKESLPPLLSERAAAQAVAFSPEEKAANADQEARLRESNLAALDQGIRNATDPKIRQVLEAERASLMKEIPTATARPWERYQTQRPATPAPKEPLKIGREGFAEAMRQALAEAGGGDRFLSAVYSTMVDQPALRLQQAAQAMTGGQTPENAAAIEASREMAGASTPGAIAGALAGPAGLAGGPLFGALRAGAARVLPQATGLAARATRAVAPAAATGAGVAAATTPTLPGESEAAVAGMGALGGAGGDAAARLAARAAQPILQSPQVQALLREGIVPTPGGAMGGVVSRVEQKLTSIPIIGDFINSSRQRAINELNEAAIRRAGGTGIGREAIVQADDAIDQGYRAVLGRMNVTPDRQFLQEIERIKSDPDIALPQKMRGEFDQIVQEQVWQRFAGESLPGEVAKRADSMFGALARRYSASQDGDQRALAFALRKTQTAFRDMFRRSAPDKATADALQGLNARYANYLRVERAVGKVAAEEGRFTPQQLQSSVRELSPTSSSGNKRQFARGEALMQDLSDPARTALANVVPNSGTADRALWALLAGTGLGGTGAVSLPAAAALGLATPLMYSRAGSRYMLGDFPGQARIAAGLRGLTPEAVIAGQTLSKP